MTVTAYSALRDPPHPTSAEYKWWHFVERRLPMLVIYLLVATLVSVVIVPYVVVTVPSGHVGLLWKRFRGGTVLDPRLLKDEGMRLILPWDRLFLYDLRMQSTTDTYNAITKDGVNLTATINIRFRLKHDAVPQLHQAIGPDYIALLVRPEIGSRMREVIAEYTAEEVYSTRRQEVQNRILGRSEAMLGEKKMQRTAEQSEYGDHYDIPLDAMLNLIDTLVQGMELPPAVIGAINRKVEQYYLVQEYAFRVDRERKESERKKIEAEGIREFQQIVSQGISDSYVRWRGIEATLQLAQSTNSKVVIIGSGRDGLPIILGNVDGPAPTAPGQSTGENSTGAQKTVAPTPAAPLEKTHTSNLPTPHEKTPTVGSETAAPKKPDAAPGQQSSQGQQSSATPAEPRSWLPSVSDIEGLFSRTTRPPEPVVRQPADRPAPPRQ